MQYAIWLISVSIAQAIAFFIVFMAVLALYSMCVVASIDYTAYTAYLEEEGKEWQE
jgi:hypothetical protein